MLLQAYDFYYLNKTIIVFYKWVALINGNILSGVDLIRKINKKDAFGITSPLITTADGSKMGKQLMALFGLTKKKYQV